MSTQTQNTLTDSIPATPGWFWKQTHWDNFVLWNDSKSIMKKHYSGMWVESLDGYRALNFRSYLYLCWYAGSCGINAVETDQGIDFK